MASSSAASVGRIVFPKRPVVRPRRRGRPPIALLTAAVVSLLSLIPVLFVLQQAKTIGVDEAIRLLIRPRVGELLTNTVRLMIVVMAACGLIGLGVAWGVERTTLPGRRVWAILAALPITVPAFVSSYSWVALTAKVEGFAGAALILSLSYYPLVYLPVAAVLRGTDPAIEEASLTLGYSPLRTFFAVTLPQLRPALLGGCLLVALHLIGEFGAFAMLRFPTFTTAIYDQYRLTFNGAAASMLTTVLMLISVVLLVVERQVGGVNRYAWFGGVDKAQSRRRLGWSTPIVFAAFAALMCLALGVPMASLGYWLARGSSDAFPLDTLVSTAESSLRLGLAAAVLTTVLALPIALLTVRYRGALTTVVERGTYLASSLPGIVVALALVSLSVQYLRPLYQSTSLLVLAYSILFLPLGLVALRSAIAQVPRSLEETAQSLGCPPFMVFFRVTLPMVRSGVGAAAALVFLSVVTEVSATLILAPIGTHTLATELWANTSSLAYAAAAPYAALMVAISSVPTYLLARRVHSLGEADARS